jgi:hypothetical protein
MSLTSLFESFGAIDQISAAVPVTWGAAKEVPVTSL